MGLHHLVEGILAGMPERRVPEIVRKGNRLAEVFVQPEGTSYGARDLGNLEGVGQASTVVVAFVIDEDLRLVLEATKRPGIHDPLAVALKRRSVLVFRLGVLTPR